jgi:hypothetical protein
VGNSKVLVHNCEVKYRGGSSVTPRKGVDYKVDKDGYVNERGISLNSNKKDANIQKYGGAFEIDQKSIPDGLKIKPQGKDGHFEIQPTRKMKEAEFLELMKQVKVKKTNKI